jgi:hypothetical protein
MSEVKVDTISERTTDAGVTIEGVKVEDGVATFQTAAGSPLVFEGATADAFETTFAITDPTADRTITFPDESITLSGGGGLLGLVVYTGDGTYTKGGTSNGTAGDEGNASVTKVIVEVQGGGGSGNREDASDRDNCAGGAGGYAKKFLDVSSITTSVITVGIGGPGQASNGSAGTDGGISSWNDSAGGGSLTITCNPGIGGNNTSYVGANGGTAVNGDINIQGGVGSYNFPAQAGGSILGNAGVSLLNSALTGGKGYGSGGGSGRSTTSGAGAPGIILIWEYA